ncbi:WD40 repeat-like protein [Rhizopogon salebrosus TDB-379]|nr:WD40 repeat-like protein [Rhizopogon salebrosus TDB-379]
MPAIASRSTPSAAAGKLVEVMTLEGHETYVNYLPDGQRMDNINGISISYFPDGKQMISGYGDKTVRLWDLRAGKEIEEARIFREQEVCATEVSRDGHLVITAGGNPFRDVPGKLEAREVDTGIVKTFDGHSRQITCVDISMDSKQLASGSSDGTVWIWSLDTGELVAGPFEHDDWVGAVRFSQDLKKLAVRSWTGKCLDVWDIQAQKLNGTVGESGGKFFSLTPTRVFWTTKDRTIVVAFTFNTEAAKTIYEFDSSTLEAVGTPFEGHTSHITGLALSFDCALLASASYDSTIKLWAFESRQLLASFDQSATHALVLSPDSRQLAYTTYEHGSPKIYIFNIPPYVLSSIWPAQEASGTVAPKIFHNSDPLNVCDPFVCVCYSVPLHLQSDATTRPPTHRATTSFATQSFRPSPIVCQHPLTILRHLHKLLPSSFRRSTVLPVRNDEPCDPLDVPATSSRDRNLSHSTQGMRKVHPGMIPGENLRSVLAPPTTQSSATTSTTGKVRPHLLSWWSSNIGRASVPIVDVPLAPGQLRHAAADAPKANDDEYVHDEDFDPTSLPKPNSQRASTLVLTNGGEHGSGSSCLCFKF